MARAGYGRSWSVAEELLEMAKVDTAFADLYLERARELVSTELTEAQRAAFRSADRDVADLTSRIAAALEDRDWKLVRELTSEAADLPRAFSEDVRIGAIAMRVHGFDEVLVDPFSPGTSELAGVAAGELPTVRDAALKRLDRLSADDPPCADLYQARRTALGDARVVAISATVSALEAEARAALDRRNLARLHKLSTELETEARAEAAADGGGAASRPPPAPPFLARPFPVDASVRALKLGLTPHLVPSAEEEIRERLRPGWRVSLGDPSGNTVHFSMTIPGDANEALRESVALFMNRAFLTSAGTRYVPWCVDENVLVEAFEEAPAGAAETRSPLLAALGLRRRAGLARREIERALRERGPSVVRDLGLDPREYRLVCIPGDVYVRLGSKLGWGRQKTWTHLDGYMVSDQRRLMPLAGGDVRFGGLHDLVALGAEYASDRLVARFAVVQRRRFAPV